MALGSMGAAGALSDPGVIAGFAWDELAGGKDAVIDIGGGRVRYLLIYCIVLSWLALGNFMLLARP